LASFNGSESYFEDGQTGNFSIKTESKIELLVKTIIALQQIEYISLIIGEVENGGFKTLIRELLSGNTSHVTYMLTFYQKQERARQQLSEIII
jgi:hypothetical protein